MQETNRLQHLVRFGEYELDTRAGGLHKGGTAFQLHKQPLQVLLLLLEHPGELVTREELRKALWPNDTFGDFEDSLNHAIRRLREALGESAENPRFIETIPRRGYRFIHAIDQGVGAAPPKPVQPMGPLGKCRLIAAGAVTVAAALALVFVLDVAGLRTRLLKATSAKGLAAPPRIESIAVLPFENLSGDPAQEYFADGMTEELVTNLGKISALRVISRTSVERYKGTKKPLPEIARELSVDAIVEGTVQRSGNHVRVTANLLYAPTDRHLWADSYESELGDILALQGKVARSIGGEIGIKLISQQQTRLASIRSVNPDAYEAYLKGKYYASNGVRKDSRRVWRVSARRLTLILPTLPPMEGWARCTA